MLSKIVSVGDRIDIVIAKGGQEEENENENVSVSYPSKVCDIINDDRLACTMPVKSNKLVVLPNGLKFEMFFYSGSSMYKCMAMITDRYKEKNVYLLEVELLSELEKYQRRQFYRLEVMLDIKYKKFTEEEYEMFDTTGIISQSLDDRSYTNGTTVDISGGGVKFVSHEQLSEDTNLYCVLKIVYLGIEYNIGIVGNILTSMSVLNRAGFYEHRMEYTTIDNDEREVIIKYIFEEERKKRKNRKA